MGGGGGSGSGAAAAATAVVTAVSRVVRVRVTHHWAVHSMLSFVVSIGVALAAQVGVSTDPPVMRVVVQVLTFCVHCCHRSLFAGAHCC